MTTKLFFRWTDLFTEAEAAKKTAVSVSIPTNQSWLGAKRFQPFFYLERDL
jgi:hypothetical protein